ncbi:MAG: hypothetical protein KAS39_07345, partial [Actinomycetia bacterium]|nr:hypothetical protein [Actinomycetes bacterium]
ELDSDERTAKILGAKVILEKPFIKISKDNVRKAKKELDNFDTVVLTDVPFGPGNIDNLGIIEEAIKRGIKVVGYDVSFKERSFSIISEGKRWFKVERNIIKVKNHNEAMKEIENG